MNGLLPVKPSVNLRTLSDIIGSAASFSAAFLPRRRSPLVIRVVIRASSFLIVASGPVRYAESMSRSRSEPSLSSRWQRILPHLGVYSFLLYVLSVGPLYWEIYAAYVLNESPFLQRFYLPLVKASEIDYVSNFLNWYISLWL